MAMKIFVQSKNHLEGSTPTFNSVVERRCDEHGKNKPALDRFASGPDPDLALSIFHEVLHSRGQPLDAETHFFMEPCFGHDFSQVRVHTDAKASASARSDRPTITASPGPEGEAKTPKEAAGSSSSSPHPFTAVALEASTRGEGCTVPAGQHGASKCVRFRIMDFQGRPVRSSLTIGEHFRRIEGPEAVYRQLTPNSYTSERGFFNDRYCLYQPTPLPSGLHLKVEQNHLVDGEVISKNHIVFTPNSILVCVFPRPAGQRDFRARCRIY